MNRGGVKVGGCGKEGGDRQDFKVDSMCCVTVGSQCVCVCVCVCVTLGSQCACVCVFVTLGSQCVCVCVCVCVCYSR